MTTNPSPYLEQDQLNIKQTKLLEALLSGKGEAEALIWAGYKPSSTAIIFRIRPLVRKLLKDRQERIVEETITRGDCVKLLDKIARDNSNPRLQILAIQQLGKILGYESPTKTENKNENITLLKFEEDK
jgi:hypothetical protein